MTFTPLSALLGGALIGLSASVLLVVQGRVAGVSGILGGIVQPRRREIAWRVAFLAGLFLGGSVLAWRVPEAIAPRSTGCPQPWWRLPVCSSASEPN